MKKRLVVVVVLGAVGITLFFLLKSPQQPAGTTETVPASLAGLPDASATAGTGSNSSPALLKSPGVAPAVEPVPAIPPIPTTTAAPVSADLPLVDGLPPATVLDNMRRAVREYGQRFNGNPVGTNPEITKALNGGNPKQVKFIPPGSGLRINGQGELIDSWGTPFFFHQLSGTDMEVHSAGPDKIMWTDDDLVTR